MDDPTDPTANLDPLAPFRWHPEPELIGIRDGGLESGGRRRRRAGLADEPRWLYDEAMAHGIGLPMDYPTIRRTHYGEAGGPGKAPQDPTSLQHVLDEFAARIAPHAQLVPPARGHRYFTPPPLVASIAGRSSASGSTRASTCGTAGRSPRSSRKR
ncbi:MAG: hypothetical protein U0838_13765 [Chloroflexota bacterium]